MEKEAVSEYVDHARSVIDSSPQMDEANTKTKLLRDFIEVLGWDITTEVELEYSLQMATRTHRVDYALKQDGTPAVFLEAKGCDTDLTKKHRRQLRSYMMTQNVAWGLLTNGVEYEILRRRINDDEVTVETLGQIELSDLPQRLSLISTVSKESIKSGRSEQIVTNILELEKAHRSLREQKDELVDEITQLVVEEVGDSITQRTESGAKSFIDKLIESIEEDVDINQSSSPTMDFWEEVESEVGLIQQGGVVAFPNDQAATEYFTAFVDFLLTGGYMTDTDIPIKNGTKRHLINAEPVDEGDEMYSPKVVGDGFYIETNFSKNDMKQKIVELGQEYQ
jgi:hypothetical protein